ncbi:MAG: polysaccharide deacetylase family protein [Thermomonas sp.]
MYHAVAGGEAHAYDRRYTLPNAEFVAQLQHIRDHAGGACCARDWLQKRSHERVLLTFDDGLASDYETAFPLLLEHGMTADFFVNPGTVGNRGHVSWQELREMSCAGMSVQSHGYDHIHLTQLDPFALRRTLYAARIEIEDRVGAPVTLLAPPGGRMPHALVEVARSLGYTDVLCSKPGALPTHDAHGPLPRLAITAGLSVRTFAGWVSLQHASIATALAYYQVKQFARYAIGEARYERVRAKALPPHA